MDVFGVNVELFAQSVDEYFQSFYLAVGWVGGFAVGYHADSDSLAVSVPCSIGYCGPLPLPFFCGEYLAVFGAIAVAYTKMEVDIIGAGQACV